MDTPVISELKKKLLELFPEATPGEITYAVNRVGNNLRPQEIRENTGWTPRVGIGKVRKDLWVHASGWDDFKIEFGHGKYVFYMRVETDFF